MIFKIYFIFILLLTGTVFINSSGRCPNEYTCGDGRCISKDFLCDGSRECSDGSDETSDLCAHRRCGQSSSGILSLGDLDDSISYFRCSYGGCIASLYICDGIANCFDGSDETKELCSKTSCGIGKFQCDYGACLSHFMKCNGNSHCVDGSDETLELCRNNWKCRRNQFRCDYGACIYGRRKCNGKADCADGSDETEALCGVVPSYSTPKNSVFFGSTISQFQETQPTTPKPTARPTTKKATTKKPITHRPPPQTTRPKLIPPIKINDNLGSILSAFGLFDKWGLDDNIKIGNDGKIRVDLNDLAAEKIPVFSEIAFEAPKPQPPVVATPGPSAVETVVSSSRRPVIATEEAFCLAPDKCLCMPNSDAVCIPCENSANTDEACAQLVKPDLCPTFVDVGISLDIVYCGAGDLNSCGTATGVPLSSQALLSCWNMEPSLWECRYDGQWHPVDYANDDKGVIELCQPSTINSEICGQHAPVKRPVPSRDSNGNWMGPPLKLNYDWPWIVGIHVEGRFICTGTLITNQWIISAAHCITRSFDMRTNQDSDGFEVEYLAFNGEISVMNVSSYHVEPSYIGGSEPKNDIALFKLNETVFFSEYLLPACLDTKEDLLGRIAMTFNRSEGSSEFHWDLFSQSLDLSCFNRERHCSRHVHIEVNQFCASDKGSDKHLYPGSSGGPYLINEGSDSRDRWTVAGILSSLITTSGCPPHTIFSNVSMHFNWFSKCIQHEAC